MVIKRPKSKKMIILALLILAAIVFLLLEIFNVTHVFNKSEEATKETSTTSANTKGIKGDSATPATGTEVSQSSPTTGTKSVSSPASTTNTYAFLIAPSGTFANLYSATMGSTMQSTCNTTAGASCQIIFTKGGVSKSLPVKTADGGGAVYWSWKPNDSNVGLSPGTWHVLARATLGTQTKTTDNGSLELEITQ